MAEDTEGERYVEDMVSNVEPVSIEPKDAGNRVDLEVGWVTVMAEVAVVTTYTV